MHVFQLVVVATLCLAELCYGLPRPLLRHIQFENTLVYLTPHQVELLSGSRARFMDVTDSAARSVAAMAPPNLAIPAALDAQVDELIVELSQEVSTARMRRDLERFAAFPTRYYRSSSGKHSAEWLYGKVKRIAESSSLNITLERFKHEWDQHTIIVRIEPNVECTNRSSSKERIIISAHQDSTSPFLPMFMPAPGADDDGSGSMSILEAFRILAHSKSLSIVRPIEFIWFSAEEAGLLGSQAVAHSYAEQGIPASVFHIDMNGFPGDGTASIAVITDNTDDNLARFVGNVLIPRYTKLPAISTQCGYACSDHHSFHVAGYAAIALTENAFERINPNIHSRRDSIDKINFAHMAEYVKVAMAYALHMSFQPMMAERKALLETLLK